MTLSRDIAIKLGIQLRSGKTIASTPLSNMQLEASSLNHPKFAAAVAAKINKRLADYTVRSLTFYKRTKAELVVTCEIRPVDCTN